MKSLAPPIKLVKVNLDVKFFALIFVLLTGLALFNGVKSSVYYSFQNISTNWFHLSYHYLAAGWSWLLILPIVVAMRKSTLQNKRFILVASVIALPLSTAHRFVAVFSDSLFRWAMGYTNLDPIAEWPNLKHYFYAGIFDSLLVFGLLTVCILFFYKGRNAQLPGITSDLGSEDEKPKRIVAKKNGKLIFLKVEEISAFKSEGNYIKLYYGNEWVIIRKTTKKMEAELDKTIFCRVNRSVIVNVDCIKNMEHYFGGRYLITMQNNMVFQSSKTFKKTIDALLNMK